MKRPFLPAPEPERCCAVTFQGYYAARCPYRRAPGSDLCPAHRDLVAEGRRVKRVQRAAAEVARG